MSRAVRYHSLEGHHVALMAKPGYKWTRMVVVDYPVHVVQVHNYEAEKYATDLPGTNIHSLATSLLELGERQGITGEAKRLLESAIEGAPIAPMQPWSSAPVTPYTVEG